jgi:glycine/D-amino acid oxidase-like deaminating enzyme
MYDLGIVGGGIHGASLAFHAARRDASVVLMERGTIAGGPTGRSSAVCRAYYTNPFLAEVAQEGIDALIDFETFTSGRTGTYEKGGMLALHGSKEEAQATKAVPALADAGIDVDLVEVDRIAEMLPGARLDDIAIGVWQGKAGWADPVPTTTAIAERASDLGAQLRVDSKVEAIERSDSGWVLKTASDAIEVEKVVIAAGPWTAALAKQVGADIPLICERHFVATFGWGDAPRVSFSIADIPGGYYAKPEGSELVCLGSLLPEEEADPDDFDEEAGVEESLAIGATFMKRVPSMEGIESRRGWASLYDVSPDWMPVIGEIAEGVYVDAGTSGHGFKLAPSLARYVVDLALDGRGDPRLAQFAPGRFSGVGKLNAGFGDARILG